MAGSLVLADLGSFGFQWFDDLTAAGLWWFSRLRAKTSYTVCHTLYHQGDTLAAITWLGAHRADRAKYAVRLVQFRQGARSIATSPTCSTRRSCPWPRWRGSTRGGGISNAPST